MRDPALGGWKMLHYLLSKGISRSMADGMRFYGQYGVTYADAGFRPTAEVVKCIRNDRGTGHTCHPGVTLRGERDFGRALSRLMDEGLDGVECFYPQAQPRCARGLPGPVRRRGLLATAGSDCHGSFQDTHIGQTKTDMCDVALEPLGATCYNI